MCLYFVVAIGLLLPRRRFGAVNLRLVSARPPLAPSYPADLAPLINGALVAAELIYFFGAIFRGSAVFICLWLRTRLR